MLTVNYFNVFAYLDKHCRKLGTLTVYRHTACKSIQFEQTQFILGCCV